MRPFSQCDCKSLLLNTLWIKNKERRCDPQHRASGSLSLRCPPRSTTRHLPVVAYPETPKKRPISLPVISGIISPCDTAALSVSDHWRLINGERGRQLA